MGMDSTCIGISPRRMGKSIEDMNMDLERACWVGMFSSNDGDYELTWASEFHLKRRMLLNSKFIR
jgi:hypothetical protein